MALGASAQAWLLDMSCHKAAPEITVSSEQQHSRATSVPTRGPEPTWSQRQLRDAAISLLKALFPAAMRPDREGQLEDQSHLAGGQVEGEGRGGRGKG